MIREVISHELVVFLTAALPVLELKAALPMGIGLGMNPWHAFIVSYLGSLLPVPFLFWLIRPILIGIKNWAFIKPHIERLEARTIRRSIKIQKYGALGVLLFVAIPLPGTGVWTGTIGAVLLDVRFKWAFPAVVVGNLIAGLIVLFISQGALTLF